MRRGSHHGASVGSCSWPAFKARFGIERIAEVYASTEGNANLANTEGKEGLEQWLGAIGQRGLTDPLAEAGCTDLGTLLEYDAAELRELPERLRQDERLAIHHISRQGKPAVTEATHREREALREVQAELGD